MTTAAIVYLVGVALGIVFGDARPIVRIAYALVWPIGIAAFAMTLAVLFLASLIAFPIFAAALLAASVLFWTLR